MIDVNANQNIETISTYYLLIQYLRPIGSLEEVKQVSASVTFQNKTATSNQQCTFKDSQRKATTKIDGNVVVTGHTANI